MKNYTTVFIFFFVFILIEAHPARLRRLGSKSGFSLATAVKTALAGGGDDHSAGSFGTGQITENNEGAGHGRQQMGTNTNSQLNASMMGSAAKSKSQNEENEKKCYFHIQRHSHYEKQPRPDRSMVSNKCGGMMLKMTDLITSSYDNLMDAENPLALVLCRGAGLCDLDFTNPNTEAEWSKKIICLEHIRELLENWNRNTYNHILTRINSKQHRVKACSASGTLGYMHPTKIPPLINLHENFVLNQNEAEAILKTHGVLLHTGIPLCPAHKKYAEDTYSEYYINKRGFQLNPRPSNGLLSDSEDADDESHNACKIQYDDPNFDAPRSHSSKGSLSDVPEDVKTAFQAFAEKACQNRVCPRKDFASLTRDSKRKKAMTVRNLLDYTCRIMAPDSPTELKNMVVNFENKQLWVIDNDAQLTKILEYTSELYYNAVNRAERLQILSNFSKFLPLSQLARYIPGLSKAMYYESKKMNQRDFINENVSVREKYDAVGVNLFIELITSNTVSSSHTFGMKKAALSDGDLIEIPNSIRKQSATEIIDMFNLYLKEIEMEEHRLSPATLYRILEMCPATKQTAAACVDYFLADALEAVTKLKAILNDWKENQKLSSDNYKLLIRGIDESLYYYRTDYRVHLNEQSKVADHCMRHALSDPSKPEFHSGCSHSHNVKCDRCEMVKNVQGELVDLATSLVSEAETNKPDHGHEFEKYQEDYAVIQDSLKKLFDFKKHVLRSKYTDDDRTSIVNELERGEALITLDFAQKLLPMKAHETQQDYFGKRGMSYHISHVLANVSDVLVSHSFVHILKDDSQDSQVVTAIIAHVTSIITMLGINEVILRSDNAGCYHSASTIASLNDVASDIDIKRYSFSEPQNGKGSCDRIASQVKRKVRQYVDSGHDVTTPEQFFQALTTQSKLLSGVSVYVADVTGRRKEKTSAKFDSMSVLYDFEIKTKTVLAKRYHGIGPGLELPLGRKNSNEARLQIIHKGGYHGENSNYETESRAIYFGNEMPQFWSLGKCQNKVCAKEQESVVLPDEIDYENDENLMKRLESNDNPEKPKKPKLFRCTVSGCSATFLYHGSLERHQDIGKHNISPERTSLRDYTLKMFKRRLEDEVPTPSRIHVVAVAIDELRESKNDGLENLQEGWALRSKTRQGRFSEPVRNYLVDIFLQGITGRKKNGKEVEQMMKTATNPDKSKMFSVDERLNYRQIDSYFSRLSQNFRKDPSSIRTKRSFEDTDDDEEYSHDYELLYTKEAYTINLEDIIWTAVRKNSLIFEDERIQTARKSFEGSDGSSLLKRKHSSGTDTANEPPSTHWHHEHDELKYFFM